MSEGRPPRVAFGGFHLESSRWARPVDADGFRRGCDLAGEALMADLLSPATRQRGELLGFFAAMDRQGPWEAVPLRMVAAPGDGQPHGPADAAFFDALCANLDARLALAGPVDALFLVLHGAAVTAREDDPEGALVARLRARLGPQVPIVAVVDLHANLSERLCASLSGLVASQTQPRVDLFERGQQAATLLRTQLAEGPGRVEMLRLPLVPAPSAQAVAPGTAMASLVDRCRQAVGGDLLHALVCGGFPLADAPRCGLAVAVTARSSARTQAQACVRDLAAAAWACRDRFLPLLRSPAEAVAAALAAGEGRRGPVLLMDVADNPAFGGEGRETGLLQQLVEAGVQRAVLGLLHDPALARQAQALGVGSEFEAQFNRERLGTFAAPWRHPARVLALSDGRYVARRSLAQGQAGDLGPSALLQVGGVQVAVVSRVQALVDPAQLEVLGVSLAPLRVLAAKGREQLRSAFEGLAAPGDILEVDGAGLASPTLRGLPLARLPRPAYPLDPDADWSAPSAAPETTG